MRFLAILNRDGGTLKTVNIEAFAEQVRTVLEAAGHRVETRIVAGKDVVAALSAPSFRQDTDVVLVGGGDGTVSAAASRLMDTGKVLAILPAGTMNLFARGLGIPLSLEEALAAFATGRVREVDIASANGRPFTHQFSIGLHARLVQLRSRMEFGSRLGKIWASVRSALAAMTHPPVIQVSLSMGETEVVTTTTGIGISNNMFGEGHLPYADIPDAGILGIYVSKAASRPAIFWLFIKITMGHWQASEDIEIHQAQSVVLRILTPRRRQPCVIDGELCTLDPETKIEIHPKALRVLVPQL
jgi:diacylglycerol kinase family enzyme